jgi:hypothetical protein
MFENTLERADSAVTEVKAGVLQCQRVDAQFIGKLKRLRKKLSLAKKEAALRLTLIYSGEYVKDLKFWESVKLSKRLEKSLTKCEEAEELLKTILPKEGKKKKKNKA